MKNIQLNIPVKKPKIHTKNPLLINLLPSIK